MSDDNKNNNKKPINTAVSNTGQPEQAKPLGGQYVVERVCNSTNWNNPQIIKKSMAGSNSKDALNTCAGSQTEGSNKKDK